MKSEFQAKFLSHLLKKKDNQGFTLIELLVVIIIIGILSAIALPSFLNQASKAKQAEAKNYVGAVGRAQQAKRLEKGDFASDIAGLEIGIPTQTENYSYSILDAGKDSAWFAAYTLDPTALKGFSNAVALYSGGQTASVTCQTTDTQTNSAVTSAADLAPARDTSATSATDAVSCEQVTGGTDNDGAGTMENMQ